MSPCPSGRARLQPSPGRCDSDWVLARVRADPRRQPSKLLRFSVRLRARAPLRPGGPRRDPPKVDGCVRLAAERLLLLASGPGADATNVGCGGSIPLEETAGQPEMAARSHKPSQLGAIPRPATPMTTGSGSLSYGEARRFDSAHRHFCRPLRRLETAPGLHPGEESSILSAGTMGRQVIRPGAGARLMSGCPSVVRLDDALREARPLVQPPARHAG
jgi:hypothetical protein